MPTNLEAGTLGDLRLAQGVLDRLRAPVDHRQQDARRLFGLAPPLFPILHGRDGQAETPGEFGLLAGIGLLLLILMARKSLRRRQSDLEKALPELLKRGPVPVSDLPPSLELLRKVEKELAAIERLPDEASVRDRVAALNIEIAKVNATVVEGPPTSLGTLDVDKVLARWRQARSAQSSAALRSRGLPEPTKP